MNRTLSPWCKNAKKALIDKDWTTGDLAREVKMSREYASSVINGRVYSESAVKSISNALGIEESYMTITGGN